MTLKQGIEINQKFSSLNDSIILLNKTILSAKSDIDKLGIQKQKVDFILDATSQKLTSSDKEVVRLNTLLKAREKQFWKEKQSWAGWMFFSVAVTVMVAALK